MAVVNLAAVYAAADDENRDAKRAIELATTACKITENKSPMALAVLSLAQAENGDFDTAIQSANQAFQVGEQSNEPVPPWLRSAINQYQKQQPWRFSMLGNKQ